MKLTFTLSASQYIKSARRKCKKIATNVLMFYHEYAPPSINWFLPSKIKIENKTKNILLLSCYIEQNYFYFLLFEVSEPPR